MCNRYISPDDYEIESFWHISQNSPPRWVKAVYPRMQAPFIRRAKHATGYERELVTGQWGLIPWFAKEPKLKYPTNNARSEELEAKASYKEPWKRGQRCIIPASAFDEPNWETGKNVWWQFRRADGAPWGLAGLWNTWTDKATGEIHESYTMLTLNANEHPLMSRMHKPEVDPVTKQPLPADKQDKRSVIPLEMHEFDVWLAGTIEEAQKLLKLAPVEVFVAEPIQTPADPEI
jgi:putative SOS response-associated peptidase YedK